MFAGCLAFFRETVRGCRQILVVKILKGCRSFDQGTQFRADMTTVGRCDTRGEDPCRKRKQNCLCELPEGTGSGHDVIDDQRRASCQSTESRAPSVTTTVEHFQNFLDLVLAVLLRSGVERMGDTMLQMVAERLLLDLVESGPDGTELVQYVDAIALLLDHPGDTAYLAFDTAEAGELRLLDFTIHALHYTPVGYMWQA